MESFKDNFSKQADIYVKYRPHYPNELYAYLASLSQQHDLVWDCGTGNGQAAIGLADFFEQVIATDPSEQQIKNCLSHPKISYRVEKAEKSSIASHTADLLTIANALHWFDFDVFYAEAQRVLKPGGVIAAWAYGVPAVCPDVDAILQHYHNITLNNYWQAENRLVEKEYRTIPFPFEQIPAPAFSYQRPLPLNDLIGLLNTWSATQRFMTSNHYNPTEEVFQALQAIWPDGGQKTATWNLILKVGRI